MTQSNVPNQKLESCSVTRMCTHSCRLEHLLWGPHHMHFMHQVLMSSADYLLLSLVRIHVHTLKYICQFVLQYALMQCDGASEVCNNGNAVVFGCHAQFTMASRITCAHGAGMNPAVCRIPDEPFITRIWLQQRNASGQQNEPLP